MQCWIGLFIANSAFPHSLRLFCVWKGMNACYCIHIISANREPRGIPRSERHLGEMWKAGEMLPDCSATNTKHMCGSPETRCFPVPLASTFQSDLGIPRNPWNSFKDFNNSFNNHSDVAFLYFHSLMIVQQNFPEPGWPGRALWLWWLRYSMLVYSSILNFSVLILMQQISNDVTYISKSSLRCSKISKNVKGSWG